MRIDLQIHSTYSDGYLSPAAAAKFLAEQGVKVAALTDHHTMAGWAEFAQACHQLNIKAVPGIELYARLNNRQLNLLWYNLPVGNPQIDKLLASSQNNWSARVRKHIVRLIKFKLLVKGSDQVLSKFANYVPTNGLLDALLAIPGNRRIITTQLGSRTFREEEAIGLLFNNQKIGRLRPSCIDIKRIIKLGQELGGQLVLGHPGRGHLLKASFVTRLKNLGIDGLEVLSPHHSLGAVFYIQALAEQNDLIVTAGSDFHRFERGHHGLRSAYDYWHADDHDLRRIKEIIG